MSIVFFQRDELYPVYDVTRDPKWGHPIEVDEATFSRWQRTFEQWELVQAEIEEIAKQNPDYFSGRYWKV